MGKHYLYRHIRLDRYEPFYIGIGTKSEKYICNKAQSEFSRAYNMTTRSNWWKSVIQKTDHRIEILLESDDYEFIKQKEKEFIALYGRQDLGKGTLVNMTDGGDGTLGAIPNLEKRLKISKANKGKVRSEELKLRISLSKKGIKLSEETKKLREGCIPRGEEHSRAITILNYETGIFYSSISEAAKYHDISVSHLGTMLRNSKINWTSLVYAKSESDSNNVLFTKFEPYVHKKHTEYTKQKLSLIKKGRYTGAENGKSKKVLDLATNIIYDSAKQASSALGVDYQYFCAMLNPNNKKRNKTSLIYKV